MEIFRKIRTFVLESDAVAGLQTRMMANMAATEPFRPIFRALDIEYKLDKIQKDGYKDDIRKFYEEITRARK